MTKTTELAIRAKAAIRYPGWRLDIGRPHHRGAYQCHEPSEDNGNQTAQESA